MTSQQRPDLQTVASLAEPLRRSLYDFVARSPEPVSRDQAAAAVAVSRQVAAYHLDLLAEDGWLDIEYKRLTGREGPGAGRPAKLYRRSDRVYEVSIPARRYELAARILLEAVGEGNVDQAAVSGIARRVGHEMGSAGLSSALTATGYEPAQENGDIRFRNCPFHVLVEQDRQITCNLNLALVEGMIEGAGSDLEAVLAPEDGYCCVRIRATG